MRPALTGGRRSRRRAAEAWAGTAADLGGGDAVDKADLLESLLAHGETNLPALVHRLIYHLERHPGLVQLVLHIQIHVAPEAVDLVGQEGEEKGLFNGKCGSIKHSRGLKIFAYMRFVSTAKFEINIAILFEKKKNTYHKRSILEKRKFVSYFFIFSSITSMCWPVITYTEVSPF